MTRSSGSDEPSYTDAVAGLREFGHLVTETLRNALASNRINFHSVDYRVKSLQSATQKLAKKPDRYRDYRGMHDLLGVRIITYFNSEVGQVAKLIEEEFRIDRENSGDKSALLNSKEFGYLSVHYVASLSPTRSRLPEYRDCGNIRFEIQIRTILQHAWAEIEHDLGYKAAVSLPDNIKRDFARVAGLLETADTQFETLLGQVKELERAATQSVELAPRSLLTPQTALAVVRRNVHAHNADHFIARLMHATLRGSGHYTTQQDIAWLAALGIRSIEDLLGAYRENAKTLRQFAELWINRPEVREDEGGGNSRLDHVEHGISIYYMQLLLTAKSKERDRKKIYDMYSTIPEGEPRETSFALIMDVWQRWAVRRIS